MDRDAAGHHLTGPASSVALGFGNQSKGDQDVSGGPVRSAAAPDSANGSVTARAAATSPPTDGGGVTAARSSTLPLVAGITHPGNPISATAMTARNTVWRM